MKTYTVSLIYCESVQAETEKGAIETACESYTASPPGLNDLEVSVKEEKEFCDIDCEECANYAINCEDDPSGSCFVAKT